MPEFDSMFDDIDLVRKGYITTEQLHEFCEQLYYSPLCVQHVEGAVELVCGSSARVSRKHFLDTLTEIERRKGTDEQAYWDFQALDYTGINRISLHDALLLFREIHGDNFSLGTWKRFLVSRPEPDADVFYDEIRFWLCTPPFGTPCTDKEFKEEENKILMRQTEFSYNEYANIKNKLDDDESRQRKKVNHEEDNLSHAHRKLHKWEKQGVKAMLFDDGLDVDVNEVKVKSKFRVEMKDINELLDMKYKALCDKLLTEMATQSSAVDDEIPEILKEITREYKRLVKDGTKYSGSLPGGHIQLLASLTGLMGELRLHDNQHRQQIETLKLRMRTEGRSLNEISKAVQEQYKQIIAGDSTCAGLLLQLHQRHSEERATMLTTLKADPLQSSMVREYGRLMRQILVMEEESKFVSMSTAVGLAERASEPKLDRSDWDRSRSERLAQLRIQERLGVRQVKTSHDLPKEEMVKGAALVDLQVLVVKEITKKHFYEREAMIHMLMSKEGQSLYDKVRKQKVDERKKRVKELQNQHLSCKGNPRRDRAVLHDILAQGLWYKYEDRRAELEDNAATPNMSHDEMKEVLLADLQQRQGLDFEGVLQDMVKMGLDETMVIWKKECRSSIEELYDNIAAIVLGTEDITAEDEEYIKALEHKYSILRKRIFLLNLRDNLDWRDLSHEDKQSALRECIKQEKLLRSEGKLTQMEQLVGTKAKAKMIASLHSLMGEDKAEWQRRKTQETVEKAPVEINVLADLVPRYEHEQEYLLTWLHSPESKNLSLRSRRMKIVELKVECYRAEMEEEFEIAGLSVGLVERVMDTLTQRPVSDVDRQNQLARKRTQLRGRRLHQQEEYRKDPEITHDKLPMRGDITGLQEMYLHELLKRHCDEREVILAHLQDESIDDLVEAAATMSESERQQRLAELQGKRLNLNLTLPDDKDEHVSILEEAGALRAVSMKQELVAVGTTASMDAVAMALLGELQEEQDKELAMTLKQLQNMNEEDIRTCLDREINNRRLETSWNVIHVFTRYQGEATDELLLKGLEEKYTVLRKTLLVDSLRLRMGTDQWEELSQKERQQKLLNLDTQAQEQIRMGHILSSLLGEDFQLKEGVAQIMGVCPHVFKNKVKGQVVTGNSTNLQMEESTGAINKRGETVSLLQELYTRYEEEKHALLRQLKGQTEEYFCEKDRQLQLAGYHRECILANQGETFVTMATWVGLLERQQDDVKFKLEKDDERYRSVAKVVILVANRGRQREPVSNPQPSTHPSIALLDNVIIELETKHVQERDLFHRLLGNVSNYGDAKQQAIMCTHEQRLDKLAELKEARKKSLQERKTENLEVLTEATVYKMEDRLSHMTTHTDDITEQDVMTSLMADLLECQNSEAQRIICQLTQTTVGEKQHCVARIQQDRQSNIADNVAIVVLSPEKAGGATEDELIEALKGKYDALKDKLLAEALMKQYGESEWNRMSETERQRKIFELKLKERQLRKAGNVDEANALLAGLLKEQEQLRQLMGDSVEDQRRKVQERLRRRKERLAQGMSPEEVDDLEREEIIADEDAEKNKRRNILDDLEHRFEQERDELLNRLRGADDDLERERERQATLARLRRDQRLARNEDKFGSAALILGLAEKHDKDLRLSKEEERERQKRLACERLEAARQRRHKPTYDDTSMHVVDEEDPVSLQEGIARDMDIRHRREREIFMKLLDESVEGKARKEARKMSDDEKDDKMFEFGEMYKNWLKSDNRNKQEQADIFKDAAGYKLEVMSSAAYNSDFTDNDHQVALLANLQEQQKHEAQRLLQDIENKDIDGLQLLHTAITLQKQDGRQDGHHENIGFVLLGDQPGVPGEITAGGDEEGELTEASVVKALEHKYDAMKDQLLIEALMKEIGERDWESMSEKQRQRKLIDLKLKERQLRKAGKLDEIANIIGSHLENEKMLDELVNESKKSQKQRLAERLARKKQLLAEREAAGLSTDDETLDAIIQGEEVEEDKRKRRNILEDLEKNFDDEKSRLLKTLSSQQDKMASERQRQIEMAKIKRDERMLQKGNKLSTVSTIINNAKDNEKRREQGIQAEHERQRNVARERLEERRHKKQGNVERENTAELEVKLAGDEARSRAEDALRESEGESVHEALLLTIETKQDQEIDMLMALQEMAKSDQQQMTVATNKPEAELKSDLMSLEQEQMRWRSRSVDIVGKLDEKAMTTESSREHMTVVAQNRSNLIKLLSQAIVCRMEVDRRQLQQTQPDMSHDQLVDEVQVTMVTDLQEKQASEQRAIQKLIETQDEATLRQMKQSQHVACREGWFDNLVRTIFQSCPGEGGTDEEREGLEEEFQKTLEKMEEDFENGKEEFIAKAKKSLKPGEDYDEEAMRQKVLQEYEDKRKQMLDDMMAQKEVMFKKLSQRKMSREQKDYESLAARELLALAKDQRKKVEKGVADEKGRQANSLQKRLSERRLAREEARSVREQYGRESTLDDMDNNTRPSTTSDRPRSNDSTKSPGFLKREKTVINLPVEDHETAMNKILQQQTLLQTKLVKEQERQARMLKQRIDARQGKQKNEAAQLLSLGERQKTVLERTRQDEKERQLQKMKDKVSRAKEKREPSPGGAKLQEGK